MKMKLIYAFALALGTAALGSMNSAQAATSKTDPVKIPFRFEVGSTTLPSGQYRIEQESGSSVVTLVNISSGERVSLLRSNSKHSQGKAVLTFEPGKQAPALRIS